MATKCSKTIITLLVLIMLMTSITGNVHATDQVPDNKVLTPATATFFYGQPKANISCKFLGTPYGVYWMKGSTPATAETILSRKGGEVFGPRFDDGSLNITEDYSLVFNNIQAGDEGNYICSVSNHNGFLIINNTDVRVLDPAQVSIFTEPSITGWAGHSVNLQCAFRGTPERVLWNRVQGPSVETVLRYMSDGYEVLGDRRYSWSDNYGLIIRDLRVLDEGNFTCMVLKTDGTKMQNMTVLTVQGNVHATDQVPDNQVWTPATTTFFYGQPKANISCKFLGSPYGVYWMKGSTPATADTLIYRTKGKVFGPKFDDGTLTITEDFSLVFNNVQAGDEGKYICRVSNHNGFLIDNNTDVRVLDPAQVSIFTEPYITGWAGHSVNLQCAFIDTPQRVLWNRVQGPSVETVLRYTSGGYEVLGDRRYSWSDNYGLIIMDPRVLDEGNFTCMVSKTGGTEIHNTTVLAVYARAEKPYIQIAQCKSQPESVTNGTTPEPCQYSVTEHEDFFELQCSVIRAKPQVNILWQEESQNLTVSPTVTQRNDGAFDVTATIIRRTNESSNVNFRCIASGLAVNGTAELTVIVQIIKPVQGSLSGSLSGGYIFLILLVIVAISAFLIFVVCRGWRYHKLQSIKECPIDNYVSVESQENENPYDNYVSVESQENADSGSRRGFKWIMTRDCVCWVFGCKKQEDRTHESVEIESLNEEEIELGNLREKLTSYRPGKDTGMAGVDIPDSSIYIGLFGAMCAGKSSLINSLHFALTDEYKNVAIEAGNTAGGGQTKFREPIQLTDLIHIVDNRGMKDFSSEQIEKHLMPQIRGERGLDPKKKVKNGTGIQIHCPVFVCNLSQRIGRASTLEFITEFSKKVHGHFGRTVMVAVTHKGKLDGSAEADGSVEDVVRLIKDQGGVPRNSIWTFENYTEDCQSHDAMKSIEYLKFLSTCLDIGERNIRFQLEREAEQPIKKKNFLHKSR